MKIGMRFVVLLLAVCMLMSTVIAVSAEIVRGDVNLDGQVNSKDYLMLKRYVLGTYDWNSNGSSNAGDSLRGDVNLDGQVNSKDYLMLKRYVLGTYDWAPSGDNIQRTWHYSTGTFIQLWAFTSYTAKQWDAHIGYLKEAGFDTLIIQSTLDTKDNQITSAYYPTALDEYKSKDYYCVNVVEKILQACQKQGMKVFLGLNNPSEWFTAKMADASWNRKEAEIGVAQAQELYDLYYEKYKNTIAGWYFVQEYYGGMGFIDLQAELLNAYLDGLTEIDPSLPMMLSPFLSSSASAKATAEQWKSVFAKTRFRKGDIFACQDSVGAGGIKLDQLDEYFSALKGGIDTKPELVFWANNEDFTPSFTTAPMDRFVKQMDISAKYVTGFITFAYSHYRAPDKVGKALHEEYVEYYNTGKYQSSEIDPYGGKKELVSKGASYTGTVNTRKDGWDDDGKKLTDGEIPGASGNTTAYYGSANSSLSIVLDLGKEVSGIREFDVYNTYGDWGISSMTNVTYSVSTDGTNWTKIGFMETSVQEHCAVDGSWYQYDFKYVSENEITARYIRYDIKNAGHLWIGELCAFRYLDK